MTSNVARPNLFSCRRPFSSISTSTASSSSLCYLQVRCYRPHQQPALVPPQTPSPPLLTCCASSSTSTPPPVPASSTSDDLSASSPFSTISTSTSTAASSTSSSTRSDIPTSGGSSPPLSGVNNYQFRPSSMPLPCPGRAGFAPFPSSPICWLGLCSSLLGPAMEAFDRARHYGFSLSVLTCNALLRGLVKENRVDEVEVVYKQMRRRKNSS